MKTFKKTWKEAREMIYDVKITNHINSVLADGECKFASGTIYFKWNTNIKKVTSTSFINSNSNLLGFNKGEENVPYLISQAIEWSLTK